MTDIKQDEQFDADINQALGDYKNAITPPRQLLADIVKALPEERSVTHSIAHRYNVQEEQNGRTSPNHQLICIINNFFMRKGLVGLVAALLVIALGGVYWNMQRTKMAGTGTEFEIAAEEAALSRDIVDLEVFNQDISLADLDESFAVIGENSIAASAVSVENLDSDLSYELGILSYDMSDMEGFADEASLDDLDSGLSGV